MVLTPTQNRAHDELLATLRSDRPVVLTGLPGSGRRTIACAALRTLGQELEVSVVGWDAVYAAPLAQGHVVVADVPSGEMQQAWERLCNRRTSETGGARYVVLTGLAAPGGGGVREVHVPPLSLEEGAALLARMVASEGGDPVLSPTHQAGLTALAEAVESLPALLVLVARRLRVSSLRRVREQLVSHAGLCELLGDAEVGLIQAALDTMDPEARALLLVLAWCEGWVDVELVFALCERLGVVSTAEQVLERLLGSGLVRVRHERGHPRVLLPLLVRHCVAAREGAVGWPLLDGRTDALVAIAEEAARSMDGPRGAVALRLFAADGAHLVRAARAAAASGAVVTGARLLATFAAPVARGHWVPGVEACVGNTGCPLLDAKLLLLRADLARQREGPHQAMALLEGMAAEVCARVAQDRELRLREHLLRAQLAYSLGAPQEAIHWLESVDVEEGASAEGRISALRALVELGTGREGEALRHAEAALALHRVRAQTWATAESLLMRASVAIRAHRHRDARLDLREAVALFADLEDDVGLTRARSLLGLVSLHLDQGEEARRELEGAHRLARALGQELRAATAELYLAVLEHDTGCLDAADRLLDEVLPRMRARSKRGEAYCLAHRGLVALERRLLRDARMDIERACYLLEQTGDPEGAQVFRLFLDPDQDSGNAPEARAVAAVLSASGSERVSLHTVSVRLALRIRRAAEAHRRELEAGRAPALGPSGFGDGEGQSSLLQVTQDGRWFRLPDGSVGDLSRRVALHRILAALIEARIAIPTPASLTVDELVVRGWPGQRLLPDAGRDRVYSAIRTLRRMGLEDWVVRDDRGYMLRRGATLRIISTPE